ncbi:tyrosine-type recombinase/integrase [Methylocystis suflitae]|uniref:tyrosine-type recombinase/integrase n=1 Tax=Methylocystis suflitae TaxID=2951405 RepID=UPI00210B0119|nr:site-specific integrase [Methylocystis suflitae]MCQ4188377.1 integrase arm-type DNA-binding domain-containing protein [Methylocystis suflitae]
MPSTRLTELQVKAAKTPLGRAQVDLWDATVRGLSLRVTSNGIKTFSLKYRNGRGKEKRIKLGRHPDLSLADARAAAMEYKTRIARGEDPAADKKTPEPEERSVSSLIDEFVKRHASFNKSGKETERILRREIEPVFGTRDFASITKTEMIGLIETITDRGAPVLARNTLAAVRKMFNWAVSRDLLDRSPCDRVKAPGKAPKRERALSTEEVRAVWLAAREIEWPFGPLVQLLMLTGQRRTEIANLRWSWIDEEKSVIAFPATIMKNSREHLLPMSPPVAEIVKDLPRFGGDDRLFRSRTNASKNVVSGFSKAKRRLDQLSGVADWVLHDIRRTVATQMNALGIQDTTVDRVLSHVIPGVSGIYNKHKYLDEKRDALECWAAFLIALP